MIVTSTTYWPFGLPLETGEQPQAYRFGFNGMEKDPEITGQEGSHYTAAFWEYDTRIARRWNVDPVDKPWESSYLAFSGNPILQIDPNGDRADWFQNEKTRAERYIYETHCDGQVLTHGGNMFRYSMKRYVKPGGHWNMLKYIGTNHPNASQTTKSLEYSDNYTEIYEEKKRRSSGVGLEFFAWAVHFTSMLIK